MITLQERVNIEIGAHIYAEGEPAIACTNLWQIRGWLDAANAVYMVRQRTTVADHESICAQVKSDVRAYMSKRILCTGRFDPATGLTVITIAAEAELDECLAEARGNPEQPACTATEDIGRYEYEHRFMW